MEQEPKFLLDTAQDVVDYLASWAKQDNPLRIDPHLKVARALETFLTGTASMYLQQPRLILSNGPPSGTKSIVITYYISKALT